MERRLLGAILGGAAAIWILAFVWASHHPHAQALMIFVAILSAARSISSSEHHDELQELNHD